MISFTKQDYALLENLYKYKTLSFKQCWQAAYKEVFLDARRCTQDRLMPMIKEGYLEYLPEKFCDYRVTLTNKGIDTLREHLKLEKFIFDEDGNKVRSLRTPSQLRIRDKLVSHQLSLNQFLLDSRDILDDAKGATYEIALEKEVLDYDYFRPDGTISLKNSKGENMQVYVEQDMGTESRVQLDDKWDRYRMFINANKGDPSLGRMVMLFVINYDTTSRAPHGVNFNKMDEAIAFREKEVFKTITTLFSCVADGSFEIFIGTAKEMLDIFQNRLLPEFLHKSPFVKHILKGKYKDELGYKVFDGVYLTEKLDNNTFKYYMRTPSGDRYLIDDAYGIPLSVVAKAVYMERTNSYANARGLPRFTYIVAPDNLKKFREFTEYTGLTDLKDVLIVND